MKKCLNLLSQVAKPLVICAVLSLFFGIVNSSFAQGVNFPNIDVNIGNAQSNQEVASSVQIMLILAVLTLAPSILIMMTCFTRIIIIFSFLRKALSLQTTPPNQTLIALALFITFFVMSPVFTEVNDKAYQPFAKGEISQEVALKNAEKPLKTFMLKQVRTKDLSLFANLAGLKSIKEYNDIPMKAVIPAFMISELKTGFEIGFLLFIPFIVIDMVVASTLMSLGMMMVPPVMISMPFKILLFIAVDGWNLLVQKIIITIR
jgi:flagellar biosynthesis protein FliP